MSGHLDGPPPGPPDPPYIPGDLGAPSPEEFARRRASSEPRPENPYRTVHARMSPPGAAWDEGFAAGRAAATSDGWTPTSDAPDAPGWECELCGGKLDGPGEKCGSAQHGPAGSVVYGRAVPAGSLDVGDEPDERFAPPGDADRVMHGLVPPSVDLRDEDAIRRDERERLSARVYENGWCPTCAHKADPDAMPPHEVAAILVDPAEVLSPEEVAEYERCQQSVIDARRRAPMVEGQMIVGAAASPDDKRVRVTCFDPVTGESETQPLDPDNYILTLGERCEITACQVYANGTVQLTIKSPGGK